MTPKELAELAVLRWSLAEGLAVLQHRPGTEKSLVPYVEEAIRAAQAEQRRKDAEFVRTHKAAWSSIAPHHTVVEHTDAATEVLADAILAQEEG